MSIVLELGSGKFTICRGTLGGTPAVFIEPAPAVGIVGECVPDGTIPKHDLAEGGVAMTFDNTQGVEVLIEELRALLSMMGSNQTGIH